MRTDTLIRDLVADATPVRRLGHPWLRLARWLVPSLLAAAAVVMVFGLRADLGLRLGETRFVTEVLAALTTGVLAALAAVSSGYPGRPLWEKLAPLPPLVVWLGSLGEGCWRTLVRLGPDGLPLLPDLVCFPAILTVATVPGAMLIWMVRRGAPLTPRLTLALSALAASAIGAAALRLFHPQDASVMVLVWQFGTVAVLTSFGALTGRHMLTWQHRLPARAATR